MKGVDQVVYGRHAVFFRDIGDMSITGRCVGIGMTEKGLDVTKAQTLLKKMSGEAVPKKIQTFGFPALSKPK